MPGVSDAMRELDSYYYDRPLRLEDAVVEAYREVVTCNNDPYYAIDNLSSVITESNIVFAEVGLSVEFEHGDGDYNFRTEVSNLQNYIEFIQNTGTHGVAGNPYLFDLTNSVFDAYSNSIIQSHELGKYYRTVAGREGIGWVGFQYFADECENMVESYRCDADLLLYTFKSLGIPMTGQAEKLEGLSLMQKNNILDVYLEETGK